MMDDFLAPKQVAERVGVTQVTLCIWRSRNKGPAFIRRGSRIYYAVAEVENWYRNGERPLTFNNNNYKTEKQASCA